MFNRDSRWDRSTPGSGGGSLHDAIGVLAAFYRGRVTPRVLYWGNRQVPVDRVLYRWRDREGKTDLHFFSVTDGATVYCIVFDNQSLGWHLTATESCAESDCKTPSPLAGNVPFQAPSPLEGEGGDGGN